MHWNLFGNFGKARQCGQDNNESKEFAGGITPWVNPSSVDPPPNHAVAAENRNCHITIESRLPKYEVNFVERHTQLRSLDA